MNREVVWEYYTTIFCKRSFACRRRNMNFLSVAEDLSSNVLYQLFQRNFSKISSEVPITLLKFSQNIYRSFINLHIHFMGKEQIPVTILFISNYPYSLIRFVFH